MVALLAILATSCELDSIPGPGPLRYRDSIFTDYTRTNDLVYGSAPDPQGNPVVLKFDLYVPTGDTVTSRPLVIWVHGGSFTGGNKSSPELIDEASTFARKGYVNASINYRLAEQGCVPGSTDCLSGIHNAADDTRTAVRFFRTHAADYGIDPTRIAVGGTSAGAITAMGVAYGAAAGAPPGGIHDASSAVRGGVSLSGAVLFNDAVDATDPPTLDFHGTSDPLVPYTWAQNTSNAAGAVGIEADLITYPGEGHVPYVAHRTQILDLTSNFLYNVLDAGHAGA